MMRCVHGNSGCKLLFFFLSAILCARTAASTRLITCILRHNIIISWRHILYNLAVAQYMHHRDRKLFLTRNKNMFSVRQMETTKWLLSAFGLHVISTQTIIQCINAYIYIPKGVIYRYGSERKYAAVEHMRKQLHRLLG